MTVSADTMVAALTDGECQTLCATLQQKDTHVDGDDMAWAATGHRLSALLCKLAFFVSNEGSGVLSISPALLLQIGRTLERTTTALEEELSRYPGAT